MPDDLLERVARWWDRDAVTTEKRAVLALIAADLELSSLKWIDLEGQLRWRLVASMRGIWRLGRELGEVIGSQ